MDTTQDPEEPHPDDLPHLAERLDRLFRTVPRSDDPSKFHSSASAAAALREQDVTVTANHIRALRGGRRGNPSFRLLAAIADLFNVPLDYFVDDSVAQEIDASLDVLSALKDTGVQQVMLRAHGVSPENLSPVLSLLDQIRRMENLDDADDAQQKNETD